MLHRYWLLLTSYPFRTRRCCQYSLRSSPFRCARRACVISAVWILARAGSGASPIPDCVAPGSNRQSKLQFAQPPTFHTAGHAVHLVRKRVELRLFGGWCVGIG